MSSPLADVWGGCQPPDPDRPHPVTLLDHLDDLGLLAYGHLSGDGYLTDRDRDRLRILRFIADHPAGTSPSHITSYCCKGVRPGKCTTTYDDDADYRFVNRFVHDLADHDPALVEITDPSGDFRVTPTLDLLDLISYGIAQTGQQDSSLVYDREFCEQLLRSNRGASWRLTDSQKDTLADAMRRYLNRIENYRLAFDVQLDPMTGASETRRMTKRYKTRFNDSGRKKKSFAQLQQSLSWMYEHGDTAVFTTLTCDPKRQESLYGAVERIGPAFNNLNQFLKTDPSTKADTRSESVAGWRPDLADDVTGRPRERLEYLKVLEWQDNGYPHLHVLYADPPRRESDGCPWLIDKNELVQKWKDYNFGEIVDLYPLTYRDDLRPEGSRDDDRADGLGDLLAAPDDDADALDQAVHDCVTTTAQEWYRREHLDGARFNSPEGFVCWYQHGDHGHSAEWVDEKQRYHAEDGLIEMDGDDTPMQKTAGSYLGKYISKTYGQLLDGETFDRDANESWDHAGEAAPWKIALYWATERKFWTISKGIREGIRRDRRSDLDPVVRSEVNELVRDHVLRCTERCHPGDLSADYSVPRVRRTMGAVVRETVATIDFLGAYPVWNLPPSTATAQPLSDLEDADRDPDSPVILASTGDRPPPAADVWGTAD